MEVGSPTSINELTVRYKNIQQIKSGAYGEVYRCQSNKDNNYYATKRIKRSELKRKGIDHQIFHERNILHTLKGNPFIIEIIDSFASNFDEYTVLELASLGDIYSYLQKFKYIKFDLAKFFTMQTISGLSFMHQHQIVHRDIKPQNCLIMDNWRIKICDFMTAIDYKNPDEKQQSELYIGTPAYMDPRIVLAKRIQSQRVSSYTNLQLNSDQSSQPKFKTDQELRNAYINSLNENEKLLESLAENYLKDSEKLKLLNFVTPAVDLWSLGCTLAFMLLGFDPFKDMTQTRQSNFYRSYRKSNPSHSGFKKPASVGKAVTPSWSEKYPQIEYMRVKLDNPETKLVSFIENRFAKSSGNLALKSISNEHPELLQAFQVLEFLLHPDAEKRTDLDELLNFEMFSEVKSWESSEIVQIKFPDTNLLIGHSYHASTRSGPRAMPSYQGIWTEADLDIIMSSEK